MSTLQKTKVPAKQRAATTHTKGKHTDTAHLDLFHQYRSAARGEESKKETPRAKAPPPHRLTITSDADTDSEASSEPSWEEESDDEAFFAKLKKKKISDVTDSENESEEEESSEEEEKPSKKVRKGNTV
ncbi:hypothetical protein ADEAN_000039500 [Angomonas deanei]|uniref:Uncharacterized protein n=1 Tax=Angomonas deanei TaxID=59799 RepID=A0A7G2BZJ6_9TRYP|nr:hypothetical protein ADEAN_000039500 [Angomonas deanei]